MTSSTKKHSWKPVILAPVFIPAMIISVLLVVGTLLNPQQAQALFSHWLTVMTRDFGWFYMLAVASFLVFVIGLCLSPFGRIRLGPDHAEPQYGFFTWFAMLFVAGYGVALMFFGVAEPVLHYASPPSAEPQTVAAAKEAMQIAYFHWGFHIWGIYALAGLVLAYFAYRHGLPLTMRSALYPLIGERIHGPIGHSVDVIAILGTLFGVATTLGLSAQQINTGLHHLWPSIPVSTSVQIVVIVLVSSLALISVVSGLDRGIRFLSIFNIVLASALLMFVFIAGPTLFILETFLQNTGSYLSSIVERTFNLQAYQSSDWIGNWTLFIFGWTIAWAPFVGLFIARISRGRTIREFTLGVLLAPTLVTFFWFAVFGDTALYMILREGHTELIDTVQSNTAIALFSLLELLPWSTFVSTLSVFLIALFFITSSDSGSLVVDSLASGGKPTPRFQRAAWATLQGIIGAVLLMAGGLKALQSMTLIMALPFALIMIVAAVGMFRALRIEHLREQSLRWRIPQASKRLPWKQRLEGVMAFPDEPQVSHFIHEVATPALRQLAKQLDKEHWSAEVTTGDEPSRVWLTVQYGNDMDFLYEIRAITCERPAGTQDTLNHGSVYQRAEVFLKRGGLGYDLYGFHHDDIIQDVLDQLEKYFHFRHIAPNTLPWNMEEN